MQSSPFRARNRPSLNSVQQLAQLYVERFRELVDDHDRRVAGAAFKVADIRPMDLGMERKRLLRPAFLLA